MVYMVVSMANMLFFGMTLGTEKLAIFHGVIDIEGWLKHGFMFS